METMQTEEVAEVQTALTGMAQRLALAQRDMNTALWLCRHVSERLDKLSGETEELLAYVDGIKANR